MKNSKTLKNVIEVLTAFYLLLWLLWLWLHWSSTCFHGWECLKISFKLTLVLWCEWHPTLPKHPQPLAAALPTSLKRYLYLPSHHHSQLPPYPTQERSFSLNIDLCNRAWRFSWSCPLCSSDLKPVVMLISFPFTSNLPLTQGFSAVPIVWVSK